MVEIKAKSGFYFSQGRARVYAIVFHYSLSLSLSSLGDIFSRGLRMRFLAGQEKKFAEVRQVRATTVTGERECECAR